MAKRQIFTIVSEWSKDYGDNFTKSNRMAALEDLFDRLQSEGYDEYEIKNSRAQVMARMVGPRSPFGQSAWRDWKKKTEDAFMRVWMSRFDKGQAEEVEPLQVGNHASMPVGEEEVIQTPVEETATTDIDNSEKAEEPEKIMDRSMFDKIQTTQPQSTEDFMKEMGLK